MTLHPRYISEVPEETQKVARAAFRKGNRYMRMRDELGTLFNDEQFTDLFPNVGQLAESPWRLALVTVMQFAENLTDRQAAEAVRGRIDWKYALSLGCWKQELWIINREPGERGRSEPGTILRQPGPVEGCERAIRAG